MKKILLTLLLGLFGLVGYGQLKAPRGLIVGDIRVSGTNITKIDSIIVLNDTLKFFGDGGTEFIITGVSAKLQYRIDIGDAPSSGDSTLTDAVLINKILIVSREGNIQYQNSTVNNTDGFKFDSSIGKLTFRPEFGPWEQIIILYK